MVDRHHHHHHNHYPHSLTHSHPPLPLLLLTSRQVAVDSRIATIAYNVNKKSPKVCVFAEVKDVYFPTANQRGSTPMLYYRSMIEDFYACKYGGDDGDDDDNDGYGDDEDGNDDGNDDDSDNDDNGNDDGDSDDD